MQQIQKKRLNKKDKIYLNIYCIIIGPFGPNFVHMKIYK